MLSCFHSIPERHGRTDRQTDGRTDRIPISISRVSVLTRNKNVLTLYGHIKTAEQRTIIQQYRYW